MVEKQNLENKLNKSQMVNRYSELIEESYEVTEMNDEKPWGAYWRINDDQVEQFVGDFFPGVKIEDLGPIESLSPKILLVAPSQRLSWQYHDRRAELWSVLKGPVVISQSVNDQELSPSFYFTDEVVKIEKGMRHRLMSSGDWGIVAEVWMHTDSEKPSDEEDIVRLADDYQR